MKTYVIGLHTVNPFSQLQRIKFGWYKSTVKPGVGFNFFLIGIHVFIDEIE